MEQEEIIRRYFKTWIDNSVDVVDVVFSKDAVYTECYGPVYMGLAQIHQWFVDWHLKGRVLKWDIQCFYHDGLNVIVEWYFECDYDHEVNGFDGVSLIQFDEAERIVSVKEFSSKSEHIYPYEKVS